MGETDSVRAFSRGLAVLRELNVQRYATALQLSRATKIPRASIYRLLDTLVEAGFVQQVVGGDQYVLRSAVADLSSGVDRELVVVESAQSVVRDLNRSIDWPVLLHSFDGNALTTRQVTNAARNPQHLRVGGTIPVLFSSPGRLSLASVSQPRQTAMLAALVNKLDRKALVRNQQKPLDRLLEEVKRRGCGFREGGYVPRTCSFALPISVESQNLAFLTIVFSQSAMNLTHAIQSFMPVARDAVTEIERNASTRIRQLTRGAGRSSEA